MKDVNHSATGVIQRVKIRDIGSANEGGYTGLAFNTAGLQITSMTDNEKTRTKYTVTGSEIEAVTSIGVYLAPTSTTFCRFSEVDASALPGHYELQFRDERYAVAGAKALYTTIFGITSAAQTDLETPLRTAADQDTLNSALFAVVSGVQVQASTILIDTGTTLPAQVSAVKVDASTAATDAALLIAAQPAIGVDASAAVVNTLALLANVSAVNVKASSILTDTGTTLPAQVSTVKVDASTAATQASEANAALPAIGVDASVAAVQATLAVAGQVVNLQKVSAVKVDTSSILTDTGTTIPALISANQVLASARGTMQTSIFVVASSAQVLASSISSRIPTALASGFMKSDILRFNGNANAAVRQALAAAQLIPFVVDETLASATVSQFHSDGTIPKTTDNFWNDTTVLWTSGNLIGQRTTITACASATGGRVLFTVASTTSESNTGDTGLII